MKQKIIIVGDPHVGKLAAKLLEDDHEVIIASADGITTDGEMIDLKTRREKKFVVRNYPIIDYDVKLVNPENITANPYGRSGNKIFVKKK